MARSDRAVWQGVSAHDVIFVPAGTIHAIGAGLVIAEIQQRSRKDETGHGSRTPRRRPCIDSGGSSVLVSCP